MVPNSQYKQNAVSRKGRELHFLLHANAIRMKGINMNASVRAIGRKDATIAAKIYLSEKKRKIVRVSRNAKNISVMPDSRRTVYIGAKKRNTGAIKASL